MEGLEHAGAAGARQGAELPGLPIDAPEVQGALALSSYRVAHHREDVDPANWEQNDREVQSAAMNEWVNAPDDKNTLASIFRSYADKYPHLHIDIGNNKMLEELLTTLVETKNHLQ